MRFSALLVLATGVVADRNAGCGLVATDIAVDGMKLGQGDLVVTGSATPSISWAVSLNTTKFPRAPAFNQTQSAYR